MSPKYAPDNPFEAQMQRLKIPEKEFCYRILLIKALQGTHVAMRGDLSIHARILFCWPEDPILEDIVVLCKVSSPNITLVRQVRDGMCCKKIFAYTGMCEQETGE